MSKCHRNSGGKCRVKYMLDEGDEVCLDSRCTTSVRVQKCNEIEGWL